MDIGYFGVNVGALDNADAIERVATTAEAVGFESLCSSRCPWGRLASQGDHRKGLRRVGGPAGQGHREEQNDRARRNQATARSRCTHGEFSPP